MGAFQAVVIGRIDEPSRLEQSFPFTFIGIKQAPEHHGVGFFKVVDRKFPFRRKENIAIENVLVPLDMIDIIDILEVHGDALDAVGDLHGNWRKVDATRLLKIGELGNLHAVEPDFPSETPGAERRRFPVVLDKAYVVIGCIDAKTFQAFDVDILDILGRRLHDNLELVVVLETVRVFTVASVGRPP